MSTKDITIVITSFNSDEIIKNCLNSIDDKCKVIIVENSSNLEFKKKVERDFKNVECVLSGANYGYGKANNIGLKKVKTKYALILNPDTVLENKAIDNFFETTKIIPEFSIIGPHIQEKHKEESIIKNKSPLLVNNVKGFAMFLNLPKFKDVGFFDESFFIYFEEIDLCKRLTQLKKKIYLVQTIKIYHEGGQSHNHSVNREMELSRNWHWMWSTFNYHKKHKGFFISFIITFPKLISSFLKIIIYLLFLNKEKRDIYYQRFSGLFNAIIGRTSWYRPKIKNG